MLTPEAVREDSVGFKKELKKYRYDVLLTVASNGGSNCRIGSKVLDFVRRKYNNCLVDASDFGKAVNELNSGLYNPVRCNQKGWKENGIYH